MVCSIENVFWVWLVWMHNNWASEASPTLGCSIEISRDISILSVYLSCPKMRRRNYVRACSKSVLGGKN